MDASPSDAVPTIEGHPWKRGWQRIGGGVSDASLEVFAYFQPTGPHGGWSWSNAGAISRAGADNREFILIDTLMDTELTRGMLATMPGDADAPRRAPEIAILTHGDLDHVSGIPALDHEATSLLAHERCEIELLPWSADVVVAAGSLLWRFIDAWPALGTLLHSFATGRGILAFAKTASLFEPFHMGGGADEVSSYDLETFAGDAMHTIEFGGADINLIHVGPAHTEADILVHVPSAGVLFAGDVVFWGCVLKCFGLVSNIRVSVG